MNTSTEEKQEEQQKGGNQQQGANAPAQSAARPAVRGEFHSRAVNEGGRLRIDTVRRGFSALLDLLEHNCPPGREFSIVKTKLEEGCMFAVKAVSLDYRSTTDDIPGR
jgi:hypothetical protein